LKWDIVLDSLLHTETNLKRSSGGLGVAQGADL